MAKLSCADQLMDKLQDPLAAIHLYALACVKRDEKGQRRDYKDKIVKELVRIEEMVREFCSKRS